MTPAEQKLMGEVIRASLREELDPLKKEVSDIKSKVGGLEVAATDAKRKIQKLEDTDRKHSGTHREITQGIIPRIQSQTDEVKQESSRGLQSSTEAYERILTLFDAIAERTERLEEEQRRGREEAEKRAKKNSFEIPDGKGGVSMVPAAVVAAQTAHQSGMKTDSLAVDVETTAKLAGKNLKWQKWMALLAGIAAFLEALRHIIAAVAAAAGKN